MSWPLCASPVEWDSSGSNTPSVCYSKGIRQYLASSHPAPVLTSLLCLRFNNSPLKIFLKRDFPGGPVVKAVQRMQVRSLVWELRTHVPHGMAKKQKMFFKFISDHAKVLTGLHHSPGWIPGRSQPIPGLSHSVT